MVRMARKIGDLGVALIVLLFLVSGFSYVFLQLDSGLGVESAVSSDLVGMQSNLSEVNDMTVLLSEQMDNASELAPNDQSDNLVLLEKRGSSAGGVLNLFSKNILSGFFKLLGQKFHLPAPVMVLLISLLALTVTVLFVRFFFGEGRV